MALDARTRSSIYGKFAEILGADDANSLMSQFPSVEADELVTKQFLRAELGELRGELSELRTELRGEISELRTELRGEISELRTELRGEISELRTELRGEITELRTELRGANSELRSENDALGSELRGEIGELCFEMVERFHRQTVWLAGTVVASAGAVIAAAPLLA